VAFAAWFDSKALTSGLEKVNDQLELSKPAPQMLLGNR
jgi:hypothetical protein